MIKFVAVLYRKPGMSVEDFRHHYESSHAPLIKRLMGDDLLGYIRNYAQAGTPFDVGEAQPAFDCITEFHFADQAAFDRAVAAVEHPDNAPSVRADEARFLDVGRVQPAVVEIRDSIDERYRAAPEQKR
jgi:uncharacterized protein (TIGR02118 family)